MTSTQQLDSHDAGFLDPAQIEAALSGARTSFREGPAETLAVAIRCIQRAGALGEPALAARALALEGHVALHRGDIRSGLSLALEGERLLDDGAGEHLAARAEVAALRAQVSFFSGAYSHALANAERAVEFADVSGDVDLRIFARRAALIVFGNTGVRELDRRLEEMLELTVEAGDLWEQAITYNDIACYCGDVGETDQARAAIARALALAQMASPNRFALAVVHSTRADIELRAGNPAAALADAELSLGLLAESDPPNPYVLGASVRAQVVARMQLGEYDDARRAGESALGWLGERMPHTRSTILAAVAEALREAGRLEEAYAALARSAALERMAFRELSELQLSLERAVLQAEQLREQAERDWLTGLHNRRFLARELASPTVTDAGTLSVAVIDLDHFKQINDRHGHSVGDQVLVRVAELLRHVLRASDIVVRSGGEEFLVLMSRTEAHAGVAGCERIRRAIREEPWERIAAGLTLTTSIGLASADGATDLEALVSLADRRLYAAKAAGRDRVVAASERWGRPAWPPPTLPRAGPTGPLKLR
ncbi:MAG: GGDEF domain-containing protein [Acidobacteriota bacterium]|nr:GGDEF domain-containing protein [Acidobacteriota bacterium]